MRKIILLVLVCICSNLFAQKSFFGIDAGVNVANQKMVFLVNYNPNPNATPNSTSNVVRFRQNSVKPTFGVFYQYNFLKNLSLRMQAQYMNLGYNDNTAGNLDINYLTFPITFHYSATRHLTFNTGPYISFTLGGTKINNEDITKTYHKNDFGFSIGAEYDFYKKVSLAVNCIIGTKNIWLQDYGGTIKYTNRALQFTLIYKFKKNILIS